MTVSDIQSSSNQRYLVLVREPWSAGFYYLFDEAKGTVRELVDLNERLRGKVHNSSEAITYSAGDGTSIKAYLTKRAETTGPLPTIVLPHGGPWARDSLTFDPLVQYLSHIGYLVFQPNFRGSTGYGHTFQSAGNRELGGLMIDDIADGVRALIKTGRSDPNRICAMGASYGGYAAMMLSIKTELLQCVVSINAPMDLKLQVDELSSRLAGRTLRNEYRSRMNGLYGDVKTQKELLRSQSPLQRADEVDVPALIIHTADDGRVSFEHAKRMIRRLEKLQKSVSVLALSRGGGHGLAYSFPAVVQRAERFLNRYLMAPPELSGTMDQPAME